MSPVEEEGGALESRDIYAIARSLVRPYPERRAEIDKLLDDCDRHYGEDLTETAILDLFAERHDQTPLDYKSDLATLLTDKLDELHERSPASLVPADHPPRSRGQFVRCTGCDRCDDHHGWLADADGNLTGPCPTANDRAREAAA